jgi:hypothetical protein
MNMTKRGLGIRGEEVESELSQLGLKQNTGKGCGVWGGARSSLYAAPMDRASWDGWEEEQSVLRYRHPHHAGWWCSSTSSQGSGQRLCVGVRRSVGG